MKKRTKSIWSSLRRSLNCESEPRDVHDPKKQTTTNKKEEARSSKGSCSKSMTGLRDVIHSRRRRRHLYIQEMDGGGGGGGGCSPSSISSVDFLNPIAHHVVLSNNSNCEIRVTSTTTGSSFFGTLIPGTPGPSSAHPPPPLSSAAMVSCRKCGDLFDRWDAAEAHHLSLHAVTEMEEGGSSRRIVEIICAGGGGGIERVLKIHNMQRRVRGFEEYRETVKAKAGRLSRKHNHPRCIADGNELLRFHGSFLCCDLGEGGCSSLCFSDECGVCRIIEKGFSLKRRASSGGVFTASTYGRALLQIGEEEEEEEEEEKGMRRKAVMVCRVIAGRVRRAPPLERRVEVGGGVQSGFDSVVVVGSEELYVLNQWAILPCFVVVCTL